MYNMKYPALSLIYYGMFQERHLITTRVVHVACSKLKLIKYVSSEEKDDILEELDL